MLRKLLKYDLKYMIKNMSIFYVLAIFFSIITRILFSINQTVIINIMAQISLGVMFSMVGSILFNTIMRSWARFRSSLYKDESYLIHTLPVTKDNIYMSKFLGSLTSLILGFLVILICIFITYYSKERYIDLKNMISSISTGLNLNINFIILSLILVLFLEIFNILQNGFLGIILGHKENNNKLLYSFLFGFSSYTISQIILVLFLFVVGLFNSNVMNIFTSNVVIDNSIISLLIVLTIISYTLIIAIISAICNNQLSKGVNVE